MTNLVEIRAVGPPHQRPAEAHKSDLRAPDLAAGTTAGVPRLYGPYRKTHRDLSCVRVVAASAIVAGLLLGTAPVALAQVGHLLATVPAAFVQEMPTLVANSTSTDETKSERAPTDITVRHRLGSSSVDGTDYGGEPRCSGSLHHDGNIRTCEAA